MINYDKLRVSENMINRFATSYLKSHYYQYGMPMTISFLVTNKCNLRCKHCFNRTNENENTNELSLDEYEKISKSMSFFSSGLFCGGEPFIRKDLSEIIRLFRKNNNMQWASTTTNGIMTDSIVEQTEKICFEDKNKRFVLNFSLDGYEKEHDLIRGTGVYKKVIETIKEVNKIKSKYTNLQIGIVSTMSTINQYVLEQFFDEISHELEPDVLSLLLVRQSPRDGEYLKKIDIEAYKKTKRKLDELFIKGKNGNVDSVLGYFPLTFYEYIENTLKNNKRDFYCYAGRYGAYINFDGEVNACEILGDEKCNRNAISMGNLRDYDMDFIKLWNSEQADIVRNRINRCEACMNCTHETEGILPSIYFEPNTNEWKKKIKIIKEMEKNNVTNDGITITI